MTNESSGSIARVSIRLKSGTLDPADVTRIVGVQATRAVKKGEQSPDRRVPSISGMWTYTASSDQVLAAATALLHVIETVTGQLQDATAKYGAELTIAIYWQPEGGQGGYSLPADVMRRLSLRGERIDLYFA